MLKPRTADLKPLIDAGYELIPLNRPFDKRKNERGAAVEVGKAPKDKLWTTKQYDSKKVVKTFGGEFNIGVKLGIHDCVLDVDVRHDGAKGLKKFRADFPDWDFDAQPKAVTGGGGLHIYCKVPEGFKPVETLPQYPGIEFKVMGRQVVAPGSLHPQSKKYYHWKDGSPDVSEAQMLPKAIRKAIKRLPPPAGAPDAGEVEPEQLAKMLEYLDPTEFGSNESWLPILMASHHATAGEGRQEFIDWSCSDPAYADNDIEIGARWDSCDPNKAGGVTARTLYKALLETDCPRALIPGNDPRDDFPEDGVAEIDADEDDTRDELNADIEAGARRSLTRLNARFCQVHTGGKTRIFELADDPERPGSKFWAEYTKESFADLYANQMIEEGKRSISLGAAWLKWSRRRTAKGLTIIPDDDIKGQVVSENSDGHGILNLWLGWGVEPKPGRWPLFERVLLEALCDGHEDHFEYLLNALAWKIQNPGELWEVGVVFKGAKGIGKTTLGERVLLKIFGNHGLKITQAGQITGQFSGHLRTALYIFADEAFGAKSSKSERAQLRTLITDGERTYESKGVDAVKGKNRAGIVIATNDWDIDADPDDRRFFVPETSSKFVTPRNLPAGETHPNRKFWNDVHKELDRGGIAAFLYDMLNRELPVGFHPRNNIPFTTQLADAIAENMNGFHRYWRDILSRGELPVEDIRDEARHGKQEDTVAWAEEAIRLKPEELIGAYQTYLDKHPQEPDRKCTNKHLGACLERWGMQRGNSHGLYWQIPKLIVARSQFEAANNLSAPSDREEL